MERPKIALFLLVTACVPLFSATCGERNPTEIRTAAGAVRQARRSERAAQPSGLIVAPGDFVLSGHGLRVVVGGLRRGGEARGAILEAALPGMKPEDGIVLLAPRLYVGGRSFAVIPREMYALERDGRAVLRIDGESRIGDRVVDVARELSISRVQSALAITTRIEARDERPLEHLRVGATIGWGGASPFIPGAGVINDELWHDTNWIGRSGETVSTTFGFAETPLRTRAVYERHGATLFLSNTNVASPERTVPAGEVHYEQSALALARGGLSEAVRRLGWVRGKPYGEVLARLPYVPEGTLVQMVTAGGKPVVTGQPNEHGVVILPLSPVSTGNPAPINRVFATAYGHAPSDEITVRGPGERIAILIPRGGHLRVASLDERGNRMPSRLRILGVDGTKLPELGPDSRAGGAIDTVVTVQGDVVVPLEPGKYRVIVTAGPEWTLHEKTVEVTETFQPYIRAELRHVVDPGEWVGADFHLHAAPSPDSEVTLEDRIATLLAEGVRFAVPTDHNHVTDYGPTLGAMRIEGFGTVPGVEVTTWDPHFGHFNAFPFPLDPTRPSNGAPNYLRTTPRELFAALHAIDGVLVQVNHPRLEGEIGYFDVLQLDSTTGAASEKYSADFDLLEVWNGFDLARPDAFTRVFDDWMALLARGQRIVATGSSDSHKVRYQYAGYPRTYVRVPGGNAEDVQAVIASLRRGEVFVTSGPFLEVNVNGQGPGYVVTPEDGHVRVNVKVSAPPWMDVAQIEVYLGRERVETIEVPRNRRPDATASSRTASRQSRLPVVRFERAVQVDVASDAFLLVLARGEQPLDHYFGRMGIPPLAFTNPIWVDADSDGATPWTPRAQTTPDAGVLTPDARAADANAAHDANVHSHGDDGQVQAHPEDASANVRDARSERDSGQPRALR